MSGVPMIPFPVHGMPSVPPGQGFQPLMPCGFLPQYSCDHSTAALGSATALPQVVGSTSSSSATSEHHSAPTVPANASSAHASASTAPIVLNSATPAPPTAASATQVSTQAITVAAAPAMQSDSSIYVIDSSSSAQSRPLTTASARPNLDAATAQPIKLSECGADHYVNTIPAVSRRSISADRYIGELKQHKTLEDIMNLDRPAYRPLDHSVVLPSFDGYGDLNLFLQKFDTIAAHYNWNSQELLFRMKQRIVGDAEYVLGDNIHAASIQEFVDTLKVRFGCDAYAERYRSELSGLRRGTLSLEQLHLKVRSLVSRAMPGPWGRATEICARDAFLKALGDDSLRRRITCPPPETLSAVYDLAVRASDIEANLDNSTFQSSDRTWRQSDKANKYSRTVTTSYKDNEKADDSLSRREMQKLQEANQKLLSELEQCKTRLERVEYRSVPQAPPAPAYTAVPTEPRRFNRPRGAASDTCHKCGRRSHWARECPTSRPSTTRSQTTTNNRPTSNVITTKDPVYASFFYQGRTYRALIDSGCEMSVMGARQLPGLQYQQCRQKLCAANSTVIPILGKAELPYEVAGHSMKYEVLVSDHIDEIIFGADWLTDHKCVWDFSTGTLILRDIEPPLVVKLGKFIRKGQVRRLYSKNSIVLPPRAQVTVPVKSVWDTLPFGNAEWIVEPRECGRGILLARTLLSSDANESYVRLLNCSSMARTISKR
jgi:hypothetical protein